jgi:hypothetical protein
MHTLIVMFKNIIMELDQINTFVVSNVNLTWLSEHMEDIEHGRPIVFIRHRRETQGYAKVKNEDNYYGASHRIERVEGVTE